MGESGNNEFTKATSDGQQLMPKKKKKNGCLIAILVCIGVFVFIGVVGSLPDDKNKDKTKESVKTESSKNEVTIEKESDSTDWEKEAKEAEKELEKLKKQEKKDKEKEKKRKKRLEREKKKSYKNSCKSYGYKSILRNPNKYKGKKIKVTGTVIQSDEFSLLGYSSVTLRLEDKDGNDWWVEYEYPDDKNKIIEEDRIVVYGKCTGSEKYTTVLGSTRRIPSVEAKYVDIK